MYSWRQASQQYNGNCVLLWVQFDKEPCLLLHNNMHMTAFDCWLSDSSGVLATELLSPPHLALHGP